MNAEKPGQAAPSESSDDETYAHFAGSIHEYIREYIRVADQKAAFVFTISAAVLGFIFKDAKPQHWLFLGKWTPGNFVAFASIVLLAVGCVTSIRAVIPRLGGARSGFVFWNAIAERPSGDRYAAQVLKLSSSELIVAKLEHCWDLATVCRAKYSGLVWASWTMVAGLLLSAVYLMVFGA
jgi:hypothetical protein